MVVRMRHTRAHSANRRSHHALAGTRLTTSKEGVVHPRHKILLDGSMYRGRTVMDKQTKRIERARAAQKRRGDEPGSADKSTEAKAA